MSEQHPPRGEEPTGEPILYALTPPPDPEYDNAPPDDYELTPRRRDEPPHDRDAERAVLGTILLDQQAFHDVSTVIDPQDFYRPEHELIYDAAAHLYATGAPVSAITIADRLLKTGNIHRAGGPAYLAKLISDAPATPTAVWHARIVAEQALKRRLRKHGQTVIQLATAQTTEDTASILDRVSHDFAQLAASTVTIHGDPSPNVDEFLAATDEDDAYDWLIPGILERGDRVILTGEEGAGKSTFSRQIGLLAAAGLHPFRIDRDIPAIKVLILDLENNPRQLRRETGPMRRRLDARLDPNNLRIETRIEGLNLADQADRAWLRDRIAANRPDLLITGPIYKLATEGDPNKEDDTKPVALYLDALRAEHDFALILEAHVGNEVGTSGKTRHKRPVGWSGWRRWPEFGLYLDKDGTIHHWRGARDAHRDGWPSAVQRGGAWPFTTPESASASDNEGRWIALRNATWQAGKKLSERDLAAATGMSRTTIQRVLGQYAMQYAAFLSQLENDRKDD